MPRTTSHGHGDGHAAHESPLVMLSRSPCWRSAPSFAGVVFRHWFIGGGCEDFWQRALFVGPDNQILEDMEHVPGLVSLVADAADGRSASLVASYMLHRRPHGAGGARRAIRRSTASCSTSGTSTSFTTSLFVRPAFWLGRLFWKGGDGASSTGSAPTASPRACST